MPHYFETPAPGARSPGRVRLTAAGRVLDLATDAGVFSRAQLDPGTSVLLEVAPPPPAGGDLLDVGCGYGPVALSMAVQSPDAVVWAVDVNERARDLCAANAAAAGAANVRVRHPDEVPEGVLFARIASNPPIRVGKEVLHELLRRWLDRLRPDGEAYLVVQKNLGSDSLQRWLVEQGWPTRRIASRRGFRVLRSAAR
ncbi:MAG TPA: methyltransferase [Terriglobales bacterium]|nr:methyltransferase [Terriglobales bacterium]